MSCLEQETCNRYIVIYKLRSDINNSFQRRESKLLILILWIFLLEVDEAAVPGGVLCLPIVSYDVTNDSCLRNNVRILVVELLHDGLETVFGAVSRAAHAIAQVHDEAPVLGSILLIRDSL